MTARAPGREDGFTLVELLVSLLLTGMAAMLLSAAIATGGSVARRSEAGAAAGETVAAAQGLLRDRIERLMPDTRDGAGGTRGETEGDGAHLTFLAPAPANAASSGLVRYFLALGGNGLLDLAMTDAREDGSRAARWTMLPLIGNVRAVELGYFGETGAGEAPRWQSSWTGRPNPPDLVRVRVRFAAGDARRWPELLVRPATTISTACTIDQATGACRES